MKIMPPQPAGGRATTPAGISKLVSLALLALLVVGTSSFARTRSSQPAVVQTSGVVSGSPTLTFARPPATASGNVLLAAVTANVAAGSITAPSGWTLVRSDTAQTSSTQLTQAVYVKVAGSSEPSSYAWSFSSAANASGGIIAYSGVDTAHPIDTSSGLTSNVHTQTLATTSITTHSARETVIAVFGASDRTPYLPTATSSSWRLWAPAAGSALMSWVQATAGPTAPLTASVGKRGTNLSVAQLIALTPGSAATPSPLPAPVAAPANTAAPTLSGATVIGNALSASTGAWQGSPTSYGYRWQDCDGTGSSCTDIGGASAATYTLASADAGRRVRVVVSATNAAGSTSAPSAASAIVAALPTPAPAQPGCTLYVAPNGSASNTGASSSSPLTIDAANNKSVPGSVICLAAGSYKSGFVQVHSGTAANWIVWRSYNGEPVINWDTSQSRNYMFKVSDGAGYVEFDDITFDGASTAIAAIGCQNHGHHIRVFDSTVRYMGDAGISMNDCDYSTVVGNTVYRFGDYYGWASGINLHWSGGAYWYDNAPGFHNIVARNYVAGGVDNSSYHTDGNGIILDLGGAISPTLIADNVVYMNGGRGIETLQTTGTVYVVNNTLYKNALDLRMAGIGEGVVNGSSNQVWANNAIFAWNPRYTYQQFGSSSAITYRHDAGYGGLASQNIASSVLSDPQQILSTNPLFVNAPPVDPSADGQWRNPPTPGALGGGLALQAGSPLVGSGVDPRTLPGLDANLLAGIVQYAMTAIDGTQRPSAGGFDYGAYQR